MNRRHFLHRTAAATGSLALGGHFAAAADTGTPPPIPGWLAGDPAAYGKDPRAAAILRAVGERLRKEGFPGA